MSTTDESGDTPDTTAESTDEHELPRHFALLASGPATKVRKECETITEREELEEVKVSRRIDTLEEFSTFYGARQNKHWKQKVIGYVLEDSSDGVAYQYDSRDWSVEIDGRVEAFRGVIDVLDDPDLDVGVTRMTDSARADIAKRLAEYHLSMTVTDSRGRDGAFADLADDCHSAPMFGPGATLSWLDAKHGGGTLDARYAKQLADQLGDSDD